ncbi:beta-xylosidase [Breznakibacter xylanolyticus]|uniref:Beta-xylosidase n=1 Tax=Breznakibacter xylanolyticus TaxID=990 RepID=A0A2W7NKA7_9BACT|nr:family 43 glycosylhydrolase [Breznakibacter xylanolyticus]PZX11742.1 beta-xylosidase [Breznakibacter xylanolyticus]
MKFIYTLLTLGVLLGCQQPQSTQGQASFINPLFAGDYPDPSMLRDGNDYYIVHSSFEYYPGLTIWHSTDMVNWKPIANALHQYVGSVWAPDLVKHNSKYFIYFPVSNTNYVVWADKMEGPWSDPIDLKVGNIDPGHVADEQGNCYLYFSNGGYVPLSPDGLSVTGELRHAYDGWPIPRDWQIECFCMEGPKLMKRGDYYYLTVAQGGTAGPATGHMVISARSKSPLGPWENSPHNPIIRTKDASERWCSVGHGTVLDDAAGNWWMVLHGYENGHYNMGRQTLMLPVEWTADGWYKIPASASLEKTVAASLSASTAEPFSLNDAFTGASLSPHWKFFGEYNPARFEMCGSGITIKGQGGSVADCSPLLCMPVNHSYTAQVELQIADNAMGGLVLFYNQQAASGILADSQNILTNIRGWQFVTQANQIDRHVWLRIKKTGQVVDMYYSTDGQKWEKTENSLEVSGFHHNVLGGFMGMRIGLAAIGDGDVTFRDFRYWGE